MHLFYLIQTLKGEKTNKQQHKKMYEKQQQTYLGEIFALFAFGEEENSVNERGRQWCKTRVPGRDHPAPSPSLGSGGIWEESLEDLGHAGCSTARLWAISYSALPVNKPYTCTYLYVCVYTCMCNTYKCIQSYGITRTLYVLFSKWLTQTAIILGFSTIQTSIQKFNCCARTRLQEKC